MSFISRTSAGTYRAFYRDPAGRQRSRNFPTRREAKAFLTAYHDAILGCPSYPADEAVAKRLLDLFTLEKALYEIAYEAANRPAWLGIPIKGVTGILDAHAASPQTGEV